MQREDMRARRIRLHQAQIVRDDCVVRIFRPPHQLIEGRQRARNLQRVERLSADAREERRPAPRVARIEQIRLIVDFPALRIALPARRASRSRFEAKNPQKFRPRRDQLCAHFRERHPFQIVLPAVVIVTVDANLVARIAHAPHHVGIPPPNMRRREQRAVEQRAQSINLHDTRTTHFLEKTGPKHAADRPPRLIRPQRKQETRRRPNLRQIGHEIRHALARAAVGININFEDKTHGFGRRSPLAGDGKSPRPESTTSGLLPRGSLTPADNPCARGDNPASA